MKNRETRFQNDQNIRFNDQGLIKRALTHRSVTTGSSGNNERLEFLGDSVVGLVITYYLYRTTSLSEGRMAKIKSIAVGRDIMADIADTLSLTKYVYLGKSEESARDSKKRNLKANVLEAVIGALYLDKGLKEASDFIERLWQPFMARIFEGQYTDYKSELQEYVQKAGSELPEYRVIGETGPDHDKVFVIECIVDGNIISRGEGGSKKIAESMAAEKAFLKITEGKGRQ